MKNLKQNSPLIVAKRIDENCDQYTNRETGKFMTLTRSSIDNVYRLYTSGGRLVMAHMDRIIVSNIMEGHLSAN